MQKIIRIDPRDNVAVALQDLAEGAEITLENRKYVLGEDIPRGHKFALHSIEAGEKVIKYGNPIGVAAEPIAGGSWVHIHNMKTGLGGDEEYTYQPAADQEWKPHRSETRSFRGFVRKNGKVGIRNDIWIIPTVGCVNNVAELLAKKTSHLCKKEVGEVIAFSHPYGCSQMGEDQENTRKILADLVEHPNAGGVLLLGLGCENSGIAQVQAYLKNWDKDRVRFLICQDCEDEIAAGCSLIEELIEQASRDERREVPASRLIVGLKCGGSDGLSGVTANPAVGFFSDRLTEQGGTTILTEVPEMFGAERLLMNRCIDEEVFDKTVNLIQSFKDYYRSHNQTIYENPSPGNKKGGISTLEDKSLGCVQKSGNAPVQDVLAYGSQAEKRGLHLLNAPGNDLVAATALAAAGAQLVLFTTGRGTPFSCPVPTVKISSNSDLAGKKAHWIDFNAGAAVEDGSIEETGRALFDYVLQVASGKKVKAEIAAFHDMAIFKQGVTL